MIIHSNKDLAQKLETIEALNQVEFVITNRNLNFESDAAYKQIGTGYAIYAGADSPLTQAFGLGFDGEVAEAEIDELEDFYRCRGAAVNIEVSHLADISLATRLIARGYNVTEFSNLLIKDLSAIERARSHSTGHAARAARADETEILTRVVAEGFSEGSEPMASLLDIFRTFYQQANCVCFIAFRDNEPAGGGAVFIRDDVAVLGGAATVVKYRNRGVQTDLLKARLEYAASHGCKFSIVTTSPGSVSQRNVEKLGFQVLYARTKFSKEGASPTN